MNKYDIVLDIIEHPDKYSDEEIANMLSDKETAEIYEAVALTASSVKSDLDDPDVEKEWIRFKRQNDVISTRRAFKPGIRAASLGLLIVSSLAALSIGIGVSIGFSGDSTPGISKDSEVKNESSAEAIISEPDTSAIEDSITANATPILYEDAYLREILDEVCRIYHYPIKYESGNTPELRLYFRLDPSASLQETVERLNMFDSFDISLEGDTIKVK